MISYNNKDLWQFATIAGISGIGLATYHGLYDHRRTQYHLNANHAAAYHVHRLCYMLLWTAFLMNARFTAGALFTLQPPAR